MTDLLKNKQVSIIGAGISGLVLAHSLSKLGALVTIYEKRASANEGSGIILSINATKILHELGVLDKIRLEGELLSPVKMTNKRGDIISQFEFSDFTKKYGSPVIGIHRKHLHTILIETLPGCEIHLNKEFISYTQDQDKVTFSFSDASTYQADLLVGCDGLFSRVRKQVLPNDDDLRYSGYTCWRGICSGDEIDLHHGFFETLGDGNRFGGVNIGHNQIYWYATLNTTPDKKFTPLSDPQKLLEIFGDWHQPIPHIITKTPPSDIIRHDIYDRPPVSGWSDGAVVLVGDAIHPTLPVLGQGASMAIESAATLSKMLELWPISMALQKYEEARKERTKNITTQSYYVSQIGCWENKYLCRFRDFMMKYTPKSVTKRQMDTLFSYKL